MREVWDCKNADDVNHKQSAASSIDREFLLRGANINKKVDIFSECLKNIFHNFIPNRRMNCNYWDPLWMVDVIKNKLKEQSNLTKTYHKYGKKKSTLEKLIAKANECVEIISAAKDKPFKRKPHKMVKHTQTIRWQQLINCLSVFNHFVGLALKRLIY